MSVLNWPNELVWPRRALAPFLLWPFPGFSKRKAPAFLFWNLDIWGLDSGLWNMGLIPGLNPWLIQARNCAALPTAWVVAFQRAFYARAHLPTISCRCRRILNKTGTKMSSRSSTC